MPLQTSGMEMVGQATFDNARFWPSICVSEEKYSCSQCVFGNCPPFKLLFGIFLFPDWSNSILADHETSPGAKQSEPAFTTSVGENGNCRGELSFWYCN